MSGCAQKKYFYLITLPKKINVMKRLYTGLSVVLMTMFLINQPQAQNYSTDDRSYRYDVSDYLDLEAVASVFAQSRNIDDFENKINDYRNQVSNLDLNNDGYVDYLRLLKQYDRNAHVILIQAVLGNNYYQDVATIVIGRDVYNRDYIQIIGDPYLYGNDYILEPVFQRRPRILNSLWNRPQVVYVSRYYWGYYPSYYRLRPILPIHHYFHHMRVFVDVHHRYHYTTSLRFPIYVDVIRHHRRNDYWRDHHDRRFENRNREYRNKGQFQYNQERNKPDVRERRSTYSESDRRQANPGAGVPQRDTRVNPSERRPNTPQRDTRVTTPQRPTEQREIRVTPQRESSPSPSREVRVTPSREVKVSPPAKEVKVTPKVESKPAPSRDVKVNSSSRNSKSNDKSDSDKSKSSRSSSSNNNSVRR